MVFTACVQERSDSPGSSYSSCYGRYNTVALLTRGFSAENASLAQGLFRSADGVGNFSVSGF